MGRKKNLGQKEKEPVGPDGKRRFKYFNYYDDREFETEEQLIQYQRQRHFRCPECEVKAHSAGALAVHMEQVHGRVLKEVPNALPGRNDPRMLIIGLKGVPPHLLWQKAQGTDFEEHALRIVQQEMNKTGGTAAAAAAGAAAGGMAVPPIQPGMMMPGVLVPPLMPPGAPGRLQALPLPGMMMPPGAPGGAGMPGMPPMMPPGTMLPQMIPGMGAPMLMNPMMVPPGHGMPGLTKGGGAASSSSALPSTMQSAAGAPPGPAGQMQDHYAAAARDRDDQASHEQSKTPQSRNHKGTTSKGRYDKNTGGMMKGTSANAVPLGANKFVNNFSAGGGSSEGAVNYPAPADTGGSRANDSSTTVPLLSSGNVEDLQGNRILMNHPGGQHGQHQQGGNFPSQVQSQTLNNVNFPEQTGDPPPPLSVSQFHPSMTQLPQQSSLLTGSMGQFAYRPPPPNPGSIHQPGTAAPALALSSGTTVGMNQHQPSPMPAADPVASLSLGLSAAPKKAGSVLSSAAGGVQRERSPRRGPPTGPDGNNHFSATGGELIQQFPAPGGPGARPGFPPLIAKTAGGPFTSSVGVVKARATADPYGFKMAEVQSNQVLNWPYMFVQPEEIRASKVPDLRMEVKYGMDDGTKP
ncbi:unnamed protein product [Amoebophrya sp. A120]|nr:unnamed protein product [Amoebophrya sp. A120]|eukprot:GSA120T00020281001.1